MKNFSINNFFLFRNKRNLIILFVLFVLWLFSLVGNITTISVKTDSQNLTGIIDSKHFYKIKTHPDKINTLEIDFNGNVPLPLALNPKILSITADNNQICSKNCTSDLVLPDRTSNVKIRIKNSFFTQIKLNKTDQEYYLVLVRPIRERDVVLSFVKNNQYLDVSTNWRKFNFSWWSNLKLYSTILFQLFPYLVLFLIVSDIYKKVLLKRSKKLKTQKTFYFKISKPVQNILLIVFFGSIFTFLLWVNINYVEKIPHSPDSVAYLWAAKYLASGKLWLPPPNDFFKCSWHFFIPNNHWVVMYPLGHSLILSLGVIIGLPYIIPPLIGTFSLFLFFLIIKRIYNNITAIISTVIFFFSPLFQTHATTFMSHNTAVFYILILIYIFIQITEQKASKLLMFFGGIIFILLSQTRPLTAICIFIPLVLFWFGFMRNNKVKLKSQIPLFLGCIVGGLIFLYVNYLTYGSVLKTPYTSITRSGFIWGESGYSILHGLTDGLSYFLYLRLLIFPGLPTLFLIFILLSLFNVKGSKYIQLFLSSILCLLLGNTLYSDPWGLFYGPRFWYEMVPFLFLLTASSLYLIIYESFSKKIGFIIAAGICFLIIFRSINGWILGNQKLYDNIIYFTPNNIKELRGINYIDAKLIKEAKKQKLHNALIFVKDCQGSWWCYGSVFTQNSVNFDSDIVWAQDLGARNQELIEKYPNRKIFISDYHKGTINSYTSPLKID